MPEPTITLEPIDAKHAAPVQALASDPAIGATSNIPSPYPENGAIEWIRRVTAARGQGTTYAFAIINEQGEFVGVCSLIDVDQQARTGALGYWIGKPYWGHGYATTAGRRVLDFAFGTLGLEQVRAAALERNHASRRVLEKLGFEFTEPGEPHAKGAMVAYERRRAGLDE